MFGWFFLATSCFAAFLIWTVYTYLLFAASSSCVLHRHVLATMLFEKVFDLGKNWKQHMANLLPDQYKSEWVDWRRFYGCWPSKCKSQCSLFSTKQTMNGGISRSRCKVIKAPPVSSPFSVSFQTQTFKRRKDVWSEKEGRPAVANPMFPSP